MKKKVLVRMIIFKKYSSNVLNILRVLSNIFFLLIFGHMLLSSKTNSEGKQVDRFNLTDAKK